ncbi:MAG: type II toxin-antitoxin system CcdA family antitoxin [Alphaproteobacteria bacterium]|nr:type II toxin-antitoxin system CcdA family antitoxin [Alphaproteobacteria bacterium]
MPDDRVPLKRCRVSLTIREDVMDSARALSINASQAAEAGIAAAVKKAREQAWLEENREAIRAHNQRIEREGMFYTPEWARDD